VKEYLPPLIQQCHKQLTNVDKNTTTHQVLEATVMMFPIDAIQQIPHTDNLILNSNTVLAATVDVPTPTTLVPTVPYPQLPVVTMENRELSENEINEMKKKMDAFDESKYINTVFRLGDISIMKGNVPHCGPGNVVQEFTAPISSTLTREFSDEKGPCRILVYFGFAPPTPQNKEDMKHALYVYDYVRLAYGIKSQELADCIIKYQHLNPLGHIVSDPAMVEIYQDFIDKYYEPDSPADSSTTSKQKKVKRRRTDTFSSSSRSATPSSSSSSSVNASSDRAERAKRRNSQKQDVS